MRQSDYVREDNLTQAKIRKLAVKQQLYDLYHRLGEQYGLRFDIISGGQQSHGGPRTGSHRHDIDSADPYGAGDVKLYDAKLGRHLSLANPEDRPRLATVLRDAAGAGAAGLGAGPRYMGNETFHIGGGKPGAWGGEQAWLRKEALSGAGPAPTATAGVGGGDSRAAAINRIAQQIGANPLDLATVISYESAGKFSPSIYGGKGGQHLGLIQFGPTEQKTYGVHAGQTFDQQMESVGRYLTDRGYKPGMSREQLYSTINAGRPDRLGARDAAAGGAPGTVLDKVRTQMAPHEAKARALLGNTLSAPLPVATGMAANATKPFDPNAIPTLPDNPARGLLGDNPVTKVAGNIAADQQAQQQQQQALAETSQAAASNAMAAAAPPPPSPQLQPQQQPQLAGQPMDYAGMLLPRLRRGLLGADSYGLLGV
jgi:hypothetical protein